jgi:TPR repeat protein
MNFAAHLNLAPGGSAKRAQAVLRKSAEAGDRLGMLNLSLFYREGLGGFRNDLQAAQLARRAADSEPPLGRAMNEVGYYYETGRGVTRDLNEARAWYGKSAARGYQPGRNNAARLNNAKEPPKSRPDLEETVLF